MSPTASPTHALFLAYHFPPIGGGGVQRALKNARYFPGLGISPIVLTGPGKADDYWAPQDRSFLAELPPEVPVERIAGPVPTASRGARRAAERWLRSRPPFERWWVEGCVERGLQEIAKRPVDVVLATMLPYETSLAAARIAERSGLPWVADLRDPWALDEMQVYPSRWHRQRELARMRRALRSAAYIVMNVPEARNALLEAFPELPAQRVGVIPNGYDPADFAAPFEAPRDGLFRIVHTGSSYAELARAEQRRERTRRIVGGRRCEVDFLPRSAHHLLRALARWRERDPSIGESVRLVLAGAASAADRELVENSGVADLVEATGYLDHAESIRRVRAADLLFLPMHELPRGEAARLVPAKLYEYLASGRAILAAVPDGDARDLLARCERAELCRPSDEDAMQRVLEASHARHRERGRAPDAAPDELTRAFERERLAGRLARVLHWVADPARPAPEPGCGAWPSPSPASRSSPA